ncbi:MAG: hypothetical protein JXN61_07165, partial [Sedimentisphaerales bacterium]|nr:hypothetical protein [Sedimentisphaerales bacterium]
DEPTNHLDIASREMLEAALQDYAGTMILVSHDRYFLDRIADKMLVVGTDPLGARCLGKTEFVGIKPVYSYYASLVRNRVETKQQEQASGGAARRKRRPAVAGKKTRLKTPEELKRFNKYSLHQIEEMITRHEQDLAEMKEQFGNAEIYRNPEQLTQLKSSFDAKNAELDLLYRAYERRID